MKRKKAGKESICPRCSEKIDPERDELLKCPECEEEVCTARCIAGRNVRCFQCEEAENE